MGACRESYKLSIQWKYNTYYYDNKDKYIPSFNVNKFLRIFLFIKIIFKLLKNKHNRYYLYVDNIKYPILKLSCLIFKNHIYYYDNEDNIYICKKCFKRISVEEYKKYIRKKKLDTII